MIAARRGFHAKALGAILVASIACAVPVQGPPHAKAASPAVPPSCAPPPPPATFTSSTAIPIPDAGSTASQIAVTGIGTQGAWDIDVLTRIRHPAPGELEIELVAPDGQRTSLSLGNGGTAADAFNGTLWDDSADRDGQVPYDFNPNLATDHPYASGVVATPLAPEQSLAPPFGRADGVWSLAVTDTAPGNTGSIDGWSLLITPRAKPGKLPIPPSTLVTYSNTAALAIPAGAPGTVSSVLTVRVESGVNFLAAAPTLAMDLPHRRPEDLDVTVASPSGTVVTLTTDSGGAIADLFAQSTWEDRGSGTSFIPEEPLRAFVGEDPAGTWTLTVHDDAAGEGGTLTSWSLSMRRSGCAPNVPIVIRQVTPKAVAGQNLVLDITATAGPTIAPTDLTVKASLPSSMRFRSLVSSPGGACSAETLRGVALHPKCTWPGRTEIGQPRTMRIVVQPFVAGFTMLGAGSETHILAGFAVPDVSRQVFVAPSPIRATNGKLCTILGTPGRDLLRSTDYTSRRAVICGLGGDDRLIGGRRGDTIDGGPGNDVIDGREGNDRLFGGRGRDIVSGGAGNDLLSGGPGPDALRGGRGRDATVGTDREDVRLNVEAPRRLKLTNGRRVTISTPHPDDTVRAITSARRHS